MFVDLRVILTQVTIDLLRYYCKSTRSTTHDSVLLHMLKDAIELLHYTTYLRSTSTVLPLLLRR